MPDGAEQRALTQSILGTEITVQEYMSDLNIHLDRMISLGAIDEETAVSWVNYARQILGYGSKADYDSNIEQDNRIINPSAGRLTVPAGETVETLSPLGRAFHPFAFREPKTEEFTTAMPPDFSAAQLPIFTQVAAPKYYEQSAIAYTQRFGYEEGDTNYLKALDRGIASAEEFQLGYINEWLGYNEKVAVSEGNQTQAEKMQANQLKVTQFLSQQEGALKSQGAIAQREQKRQDSWMRATYLRDRPGEFEKRTPSVVPGARKFLEEERPSGLQGFIESEIPSVLEKFQQEMGGARRAWWSQIQRPDREERAASAQAEAERQLKVRSTGIKAGKIGEVGALEAQKGAPLTQQDVSAGQWEFIKSQERFLEARAESTRLAEGKDRGRGGEDPLTAYLRDYPWQQEFMKLSPRQRGFNPSLYNPSARWFV